MANRNENPQGQLQNQIGRYRFVQSIAFTTTSAFTTLNTTCVDATPIPAGALFVFQPDADCQVEMGAAARVLTNANSLFVAAKAEKKFYALSTDVGVSLKGNAGAGNMQVFVVY